MTQGPKDNSIDSWQRFFAIECNNQAWDLTGQSLDPENSQCLLDSAHAASWHWRQAGNELNRIRATMLLAEAHCIAGSPELALTYATTVHDHFFNHTSANPESVNEIDTWEQTLVFAILAHAECLTNRKAQYLEHFARAQALFDGIESKEEKEIVQITFNHVPKPQ